PAEKLLKMFEDERLRTQDERLNSISEEGLRIKDERLNSSANVLPRPACGEGAGGGAACAHGQILIPNSSFLIPHSYRAFPTIEEALAAAFAEASPDDLIFIGGSNYVVGAALQSPYCL
ncbi:MAG: hypothetical protein ACI4UO_04155, partial [Paludibacteraceae bacterium]